MCPCGTLTSGGPISDFLANCHDEKTTAVQRMRALILRLSRKLKDCISHCFNCCTTAAALRCCKAVGIKDLSFWDNHPQLLFQIKLGIAAWRNCVYVYIMLWILKFSLFKPSHRSDGNPVWSTWWFAMLWNEEVCSGARSSPLWMLVKTGVSGVMGMTRVGGNRLWIPGLLSQRVTWVNHKENRGETICEALYTSASEQQGPCFKSTLHL